jgi:hypothetical protein
MTRKTIVALAALIGLALSAQAQNYPNRVIKIMQGFPPGGNVDIIARILANEMEKGLGQTIVVEAKPGLAGALAAETRTDTRCWCCPARIRPMGRWRRTSSTRWSTISPGSRWRASIRS